MPKDGKISKTINTKSEYRNPKQIQMTKIQMTKTRRNLKYNVVFVLNFENLNFGFVSDFGFRASDFPFLVLACPGQD